MTYTPQASSSSNADTLDGIDSSSFLQELPNDASFESINNIHYLTSDLTASEVVDRINNYSRKSTFIVEPGASWTVSEQISPPNGVSIYASDSAKRSTPTFKKGFDGYMLNIGDWVQMYGVWCHGNKGNYNGNVALSAGREQYIQNCTFSHGESGGMELEGTYLSEFNSCRFDNNDGGGVAFNNTSGEQPHNSFTGPCYFGHNGNGININDNGKNLYIHGWFGGNTVAGIRMAQGFDAVTIKGQFADNGSAGYLHDNGDCRGLVFQSVAFTSNGANPLDRLSGPTGHIHAVDGRPDMTIQGAYDNGGNPFFKAESAVNRHDLILQTAGQKGHIKGDIIGGNTSLTLMTPSAVDGNINVNTGVGIDPNGSSHIVDY